MSNQSASCFTFEWPGLNSETKEVIVTGDFDEWSKVIKLDYKRDQNKFTKTIKFNNDINDGKEIFFKVSSSFYFQHPSADTNNFQFIVDGNWETSSQYKIDNSHPSNNFILKSELEPFNELVISTSKSETVYSDYTTISEPSIGGQTSPPVIVERAENNDDISVTNISVTNSEITLTNHQVSGVPTAMSSINGGGSGSGNSRGSATILSRFKNLFN